MGLPLIWFEPCGRSSRFSRVSLDLFTTPFRLSLAGRAALIAISGRYLDAAELKVSADHAIWGRVPAKMGPVLAKEILRITRRPANYEWLTRAASLGNSSRNGISMVA